MPVALAASLVLVVVLSSSALFLKYRMEDTRSLSANALRARIGVDFGFDALHTEGLRSLRLEGLRIDMPLPGFGGVLLTADELRLSLSLSELLRGRSAIGQAEVIGARLVVDSSAKGKTASAKAQFGETLLEPIMAKLPPVELRGNDCVLEFITGQDKQPVTLNNISFMIKKDAKTSEVQLSVTAVSAIEEEESIINIDGIYRSPEILDATLEISSVTPAQVKPFVEIPAGISGSLSARLHAFGIINKQVMATLALEANDVGLPKISAIPNFDERISGTIDSTMQWEATSKRLHLLQTKINTTIMNATAAGRLEFAEVPTVLNLEMQIDGIPAERLLTDYLPEKVAELGELNIALSPAAQVTVQANGPVNKPEIAVRAFAPSLKVALAPADKKLPKGELRIEQIHLLWDDFSKMPTGTANLIDGAAEFAALEMAVDSLAGTLSFNGETLLLRPITASISGKPWSGTLSYTIADRELIFDVNGALTKIEDTPLHDLVKNLWIGGDIAVQGHGSLGLDGRLKLQASADVTRGMVAFDWWLRKPVGVGASIHNIEVDMVPKKTLDVQGEASIEDTRIIAKLDYGYTGGKFQEKRIRVDVPHLEVNSAGKCVQIPYTARGEACTDAYYESNLVDNKFGDDIATIGGHFDYVSFLPDGGENPLICHDADVQVTLTNIVGVERSAALVIDTAEAHVPPFGDNWLLPLGPSDEYEEKNPPDKPKPPQPWTYTLSADKIFVPPWEGTNFEAEVYSNDVETGFKFFRANAGNGHLEGTYLHEKQDNVMHLDATWDSIPATFLIRHLELPEILAGDITGNIAYVVDQDDPRTTLRADGKFSVAKGRFIPEELAFMLADTLGSSFITLHPDALKFNEVSSTVNIDGDKIVTPDLVIDSEGMRFTGDGVWVMEGDLDYNINVAITPDMAEQIPLLMDYFNVQGFRMTQQNIELGFHLTGPTFSPSGELAGLPPIGVTIVSGAAEMTGEAIKLLDTPRQMFMSIFRAGGGILGATRTQQQPPPK